MRTLGGFPQGLLQLLGLQNFGENPREFGELVTPVVDLRAHYLAPFLTVKIGIGTGAPAAGFNAVANAVVPQGKVWAVLGGHAAFSAEAGVTGDVALSATLPGAGTYRTMLTNLVDVAANETRFASISPLAQPILFPSGTRFGAYLQNITGAPTVASSVECGMLVAEFNA